MLVVGVAGWSVWTATRFGGRVDKSAAPVKFASDATRALAAWNFDGDLRDISGRGLDGNGSNMVPTVDRFGRIDRALRFNGDADVVIGDAPDLRWGGAQAFTAAVWVRAAEPGAGGGDFWHADGDSVDSLYWGLGIGNGRFTANLGRIHSGGYGDTVELADPRLAEMGAWSHLAMVSDGTDCRLYIDGVKVAERALGRNRAAIIAKRGELRFGRPSRLSPWAFTGDLDEARLWRRALAGEEIARLASRAAPPRYALTRGTYSDTDDLTAALHTEFGPDAAMADWDRLKQWRSDDIQAWADDAGFRAMTVSSYLQRAGQRRFDERRHYLAVRFNGAKPDYFLAHDELGGAALALGSWYGSRLSVLVELPPLTPRTEDVAVADDGAIRRVGGLTPGATALALAWRFTLTPDPARVLNVTLGLRGGRQLQAVCQPSGGGGRLSIALGDPAGPLRTRQTNVAFGAVEMVLVAREGELSLRAITVVGGNPIFSETIKVTSFRLADVESIEVTAPKDSGLTGARLTIE